MKEKPCLTLNHPMDCSLPGSSVHGILQARVLEWGAIAFSEEYILLGPISVYPVLCWFWASPTAQWIKRSNAGDRRLRFDPWVGEIPWRRKWQSTPVFWPGKSHGWRSLAGYSPCGHKESDTTERLHLHFFFLQIIYY